MRARSDRWSVTASALVRRVLTERRYGKRGLAPVTGRRDGRGAGRIHVPQVAA